MNITVKELEERYKVIKINKISDDVEVVDLYRAEIEFYNTHYFDDEKGEYVEKGKEK